MDTYPEEFKMLEEQIKKLEDGLEESVKLQSHYANLLNMYDGGKRIQFVNAQAWIDRLKTLKEQARLLTLGLLQEKDKVRKLRQVLQTLRNWVETIDRNHGKLMIIDEALKENQNERYTKYMAGLCVLW